MHYTYIFILLLQLDKMSYLKNKKVVVGVVASVAAGVGAWYCYNNYYNVKRIEERKGKKSKKNRKKNHKKKSSDSGNASASATGATATGIALILQDDGTPDLAAMKDGKTSEERQQYATALKDRGNALFKEKKYEDAIRFYNYAIELHEDPVFYSNISACYVSLGDLEKVVESSTKALQLKPDYSKALLRRASAYENMGRYQDAMFDISVLSLNGDFNASAIEPMLERNLNKQALRVLKDEMGIDPSVPQLEQPRTKQELPSNTSLASFFGIFKPETELPGYDENNEADTTLVKGLKELYGATQTGYVDADKLFTKALDLYKQQLPGDETLNHKAAIAYEYSGIFNFLKNDLTNSIEDLNKALELHPRVNTYIYLALTVADRGLSDEYSAYFDKAIVLDPKCSAVYYHRGQMHFINQEYEKAGKDFKKARECDEKNIFPYIQLACLAYRENQFSECEKLFEEARSKFPISPEVPNFYAEILADKGDIEHAVKQYDIAYRLETAQKKIHVGIAPLVGKATILARQPTAENFTMIAQLLEDACAQDPRSEQAKIGLAQLKLQLEQVDEAIELFEEAAKMARTVDEKLQAITFAEASKVQKRIRADPVVSKKVEETLANYQAQGMF